MQNSARKNIIPSLSYNFILNPYLPVNTIYAQPSNCDTVTSQKVHSFEQETR